MPKQNVKKKQNPPVVDEYIVLNCPCCKSLSKMCEANTPYGVMYWIKCTACGLTTLPYKERETAQDVWNTRVK